jgi:PiT family inorganic phosphate transporter
MNFLLIFALFVGFVMAISIGANDVANSMATAVGAKAITIKQAMIIAAILEFSGAFLFGRMVTETVWKGIVKTEAITEPMTIVTGALAALIAATLWVFIATAFGLPVSTSHSIVGGMVGFGIAALGLSAINWGKIGFIVMSWFISPVMGGGLTFLLFKFISKTILHKRRPFTASKRIAPILIGTTFFIITVMFCKQTLRLKGGNLLPLSVALNIAFVGGILSYRFLRRLKLKGNQYAAVEEIFRRLQIGTSCYVSLAHGANDVANAIGPLAAIYAILQYGTISSKITVPKELLALGGVGISIGVVTYGYKVMKTIGTQITELNNTRGFSIDVGTATTVLLASALGLPISSTHTVVGSVVGVGYARGVGAVNLGVIKQIILSWLITVPAGIVGAVIIYKILIIVL